MNQADTTRDPIILDDINGKKAINFFAFYDFETYAGHHDYKEYLGNKNHRVCRFCKKNKPEVKFTKDAHVIPQFMGNGNLLSYFECDNCNSIFSEYEDSFANFFGITRTFSQIKGQSKKVPKFKDKKRGLEVSMDEKGIIMKIMKDNDVFEIDKESNTLKISTERPTYVPLHIIKILVKIGLSLLPESDVVNYDNACTFITTSTKDANAIGNKSLTTFGYLLPGPPKFVVPFAQLFKRIGNQSTCPERQIVLYYGNYIFQMILPSSRNDEYLIGKQLDIPIFPLLIDNSYFHKYGSYEVLRFDFTSNEKKKGDEQILTFSYDNIQAIE